MNHLTSDTLNLYLDGQLDPTERAAADAHLAICAACGSELAALRELFSALEGLPSEPLPIDLSARVVERIAPAPRLLPAEGRSIDRPIAVGLAAQIALAALLAAWLGPTIVATVSARLAALRGLAPPDPAAPLIWLNGWLASFGAGLSGLAHTSDVLSAGLLTGVTPMQWVIVLAGVGVVWFFGNRLLLAGSREPHNTHQEAA
jgi:hypothetical protein